MSDRYLKYLLFLPGILMVLIITILPVFQAFKISFMKWQLNRSSEPSSLWSLEDGWEDFSNLFNNFQRIFQDGLTINSIGVTSVFTFLSVSLTIVLSMGLALILFKKGFYRSFVRSILLLPFSMSPALVGISWRFMFNSDFGFFSALFSALNSEWVRLDWLGTPFLAMTILIACDVWHWTPYITLLLIGGLTGVPKETRESALVDGAGSIRVFFDIVLPMMLPTLGVAMILKTIFSLKMFDQVYMLTNGGPGNATQTLAHYIYLQGFKYYDMGYASALSYLLFIPLMILGFFHLRLIATQR